MGFGGGLDLENARVKGLRASRLSGWKLRALGCRMLLSRPWGFWMFAQGSTSGWAFGMAG